MKKLFFFLLLLPTASLFAQTDFSRVPISTKEECKQAEPKVLEAAQLILDRPMGDKGALNAGAFLLGWMSNTEYSFTIDDKITKLTKKKANNDLLLIYMACMTKFVLQNPDKAKDETAIEVAAYGMLADYIAVKSNGVSITGDIQKLLDAKKEGKMEEYVKGK